MIDRLQTKLYADPRKVILQFFEINEERTRILVEKLLELDEIECEELMKQNLGLFESRHKNYKQKLIQNFNKVEKKLGYTIDASEHRKLLIGAYFSKEYSIEAAALFNPSIVVHPDQKNLKEGELRFIMSLRATGEGHISSIEFREGIITSDFDVSFENQSKYADLPQYDNKISDNEIYSCYFPGDSQVCERILFPHSDQEMMGMEDARFVRFDENSKYYGTYTAYNGRTFTTQLIETIDFQKFSVYSLSGNAIKDKGMALFPRKVNNQFCMITRQDGFNIHLMYSDDLYSWNNSKVIVSPRKTWELMQLGNCGAPIETEEGWLLITHSVGPLRRYVISALLLDIDDPSKVIGELELPLIEPNEKEREGYVPNVVYSCGSLIHNNHLFIPYAMSDAACGFAKVELKKLLSKLKSE